MQDYTLRYHEKKIFWALFVVFGLLFTLLYYDTSIMEKNLSQLTVQISHTADARNPRSNQDYSEKNGITSDSSDDEPLLLTTTIESWESSEQTQIPSEDGKFLVSNSKCKIVDMDPFNEGAKRYFKPEQYRSCRKLELLTYVTKIGNISILNIKKEIIPSYSKTGVKCCYSNVTRPNMTDDRIIISSCQDFQDTVTIQHDSVIVKCVDSLNQKQIYENIHVPITPTETVQNKIDNFENTNSTEPPLNVLLVGIDSISRLSLIRSLPNTYKFLEENNWVPLKGYNKVDDNTFPNLMAILTGYNQSQANNICNPKLVGKLDACPMLWHEYEKLGYITAYAEDQSNINTFNYLKKGFQVPPADYYFRPYIMASERLKKVNKNGMTYCTGPESAGERIMNAAKDFAVTFKNYPNFGFFWMNSFSHNDLNSPTGMDNKTKMFLEDLTGAGVNNNSIVIFLSDHGLRFGNIRQTETGWLEERLPFIYVSFPKWFQTKYPILYQNFKVNTNKLTCPYDLHMTLKHVLALSNHNYTMTPGDACPKCKSLFEEIDSERSCEDAKIAQHWCTCSGYKTVELDTAVKTNISNFVLNKLAQRISDHHGDQFCAKYTMSKMDIFMSEKFEYKGDNRYLLVKWTTIPEAQFEATVLFKKDVSNGNFVISGDISRLDSYKMHSRCVKDEYLKRFCYCY